MRISTKGEDLEIAKFTSVLAVQTLLGKDMIEKVLPFKTNKKTKIVDKDWQELYDIMAEVEDKLSDMADRINTAITSSYGEDKLKGVMQMAAASLNEGITEEQFSREVVMYRNDPYEVKFLISKDTDDLQIFSVQPSATKLGLNTILNRLVENLNMRRSNPIKGTDLKYLAPLEGKPLKGLEGEIVRDQSGAEYVVDKIFRENQEDMVELTNTVKLTPIQLTNGYKLGNSFIGEWKPMIGR